MTRVSTNAGKHSYLRSDKRDIFKRKKAENYIPIDFSIKPSFDCKFETDYSDKNGKTIFYKDVVTYKNEEYEVSYDSRNFHWSVVSKKTQETLKLKEIHKHCSIVITK
jgi:hypothetical protein